MTNEVYEAFQRILENRKVPKVEEMVDGVSGFLWLNEQGRVTPPYYWEKKFNNLYVKITKSIAFFCTFEYTMCNRVARSLLDIGDQAETCAQLFYVKERFYGFEKAIDLR